MYVCVGVCHECVVISHTDAATVGEPRTSTPIIMSEIGELLCMNLALFIPEQICMLYRHLSTGKDNFLPSHQGYCTILWINYYAACAIALHWTMHVLLWEKGRFDAEL